MRDCLRGGWPPRGLSGAARGAVAEATPRVTERVAGRPGV